MKISVIVPVHNEATLLANKVRYFTELAKYAELIFVDGKSTDNTADILKEYGFMLIQSGVASRGAQLSLGATQASHDILLFHHFDSVLPDEAMTMVIDSLQCSNWGRFNVKINDTAWIFRIIETSMNWRSALTSITTGDQAIFVKRDIYVKYITKLETLPIMEDIYISRRLKKSGRPSCLNTPIEVSSRYWRKKGILRSIINMWRFRFLYFMGVSPTRLYHLYYS